MAWNEPGGSKDDDPWGNPKKDDRSKGQGKEQGKEQGPPDLDEVVRDIRNKLNGVFGGKKGGGRGGNSGGNGNGGNTVQFPTGGSSGASGIVGLVVIALLGWVAYDSTYIIQPAERGVVQRFGQYVHTMEPGLNFYLPRPIGTVTRVDVDQSRDIEIGYRSNTAGRSTRSANVGSEALMLTRDENIVEVQFAVQYRIKSASDYVFAVRDPDITLREATESAVREIVGKSNMDFVLTDGRAEIVSRVEDLIQEIVDRYETGLEVTSVNMQDAQPPTQVQHSFDDAVKAREDEQRLINEAEAYFNDIIPRARGASARMVEEANAYREQVVAQAEGEAQRFEQILTEYEKAPVVTRQRLYLETMESVMASSSKVMVDVEGGNNMMYLPLDKMMMGAAAAQIPNAISQTQQQMADQESAAAALRAAQEQLRREQQDPRSRERR